MKRVLLQRTHNHPSDMLPSADLSGRWALGRFRISGNLEVENQHDDQTLFILHRNHVNLTVETHSCRRRDTNVTVIQTCPVMSCYILS